MPTRTRMYGAAKIAAPQAPLPIRRSVPVPSARLVVQKAGLAGGAGLSAEEIGVLHRTLGNRAVGRLFGGTVTPNRTGLPDVLKANVEQLSGVDLSAVQVHYDSVKPARLQALAYTQGTTIHLAPGQAHHLPHEAWHVVQQAQGKVLPTRRLKEGVQINDDQGLEREAEVMGAKAMQMRGSDDIAPRRYADPQPAVQPAGPMREAMRTQGGTVGDSIVQLFPALLPEKKKQAKKWTLATMQVNSQADFDEFVTQLVAVSSRTGQFDPYADAIAEMQARDEKVPPGMPGWKDVVIKAVVAVRKAKLAGQDVTSAEIKTAAKAVVKAVEPAKPKAALHVANLLERCQFKYGGWMKYNQRTGQLASCAVREFPKVQKRPDIHATFFLDDNKENRVVNGVESMRAHLQFLHLTVENSPTDPKGNSRYWPLDTGQFTGKVLGANEQQVVVSLWNGLKAELEKEARAAQ